MRDTKAAVAGCSAMIVLFLVFLRAGSSWAQVAYHLVVDGAIIVAWCASAWGLGDLIVRRTAAQGALRLVTSIALGMGAFSLAMLGLGLAGVMGQPVAILILVPGLVIVGYRFWLARNSMGKAIGAWAAKPAGWGWLWIMAMPPLSIAILAAMFPPGILWGDEPNGYDVTEYHLQVPREWFEAGKITPLDHNVFSYFPFNMEMQYLLAMELRGGPWAGMYLAQFMHVTTWALAVIAVYAAGGTFAGVVAAAVPWAAMLAPVAYVEGGLVLYGALALIWAMRGKPRDMAIAGAMAGLACGVKLTGVPLVLLAIPVALLAGDRKGWAGGTAIFLLTGLTVFSPWLIRNEVWARNPIFPEGMSLFGRGHFTPVEAERWQLAYQPRSGKLAAFSDQVLVDQRYGFVFFPLVAEAIALGWRSPRVRVLATMLGILTIVWIGFTHLQSRFYVLAIPWGALLVAELDSTKWRLLVPAVAAVLVMLGVIDIFHRLNVYLEQNEQAQGAIIGLEDFSLLMPVKDAKKLALVGEARAFWYPLPMKDLRYRTVFDVDTTDPSKSVVDDWLAPAPPPPNQGWTIYVSVPELDRLTSYYGIPHLSDAELAALKKRTDVVVQEER